MAEFNEDAKNLVWDAVHTAPAVEVRVFARPGELMHPGVSGIDALLTAPETLAEFFRRRAMNAPAAPDPAADASMKSLNPGELADLVWRQLFLDHPPLSEAVRVVLTTLGLFGLDVGGGDLRLLREQYERIPPSERQGRALSLANVDTVLYPVESMETADRDATGTGHPSFRPVLSLNRLLWDWKESARLLRRQGFGLKARIDEFTPLELRRHLAAEAADLSPVALSLDWPAGHLPGDGGIGRLIREAALPLCRELGLAFMVASGDAEIARLVPLWADHRENRFLLFPGRADQLEVAVAAASTARNLLLCGPDRPLAHPLVLEPFTGARLAMLGGMFHACHSGADVVEELAGSWAHMRWSLGKAFIRHYADLWRTGWRFSEADVGKDVRAVLGGNVRTFLGL